MKNLKTMILLAFFLFTCRTWANDQYDSTTTTSSAVFQCKAMWDITKLFNLAMDISFSDDSAIYVLRAENIDAAHRLVQIAEGQRLGHDARQILVACEMQEQTVER